MPYKGSGPALNDLLGGHVTMMFSTMASAAGLVRDGSKVRALAVTGATRSALFPDLPTVAEAGLPGYEAVLHYGIVAPAGTPRPVVDKLNAALNAALGSDEVKRRLAVGRRRGAAGQPGRIRRRHRQGRDQVVGDHPEIRHEGRLTRIAPRPASDVLE